MRLSQLLLAFIMVCTVLAADRRSPADSSRTDEARTVEADSTPDFTFRKNIEEVQVTFVVSSRDGMTVLDVRPQDFQIFDNSMRVRDLTAFTRETGTAVNSVVLLDSSESLQKALPTITDEIIPGLRRLLRDSSDHLSIATFDSRLRAITPVASAASLDIAAIRHRLARGPTAIYDALVDLSGRDLWASPANASMRRVLVLVSDGEDNLSYHTLDQAIASCNKADITIFTIEPVASRSLDGRAVLETIAEETGGRYFQISRIGDVEHALTSIAADLQIRYSLVFRPAAQSSGYHEIRIIPSRRDWTIRARTGYFATSR